MTKFSFFGAATDTGNLGVSALCYATIKNIIKQQPKAEFTVFDYGKGRSKMVGVPGCTDATLYRQGAVYARNPFRLENIRLWTFLSKIGGLGNEGVLTLKESDAVLDISGGDSFTDLYGQRCFRSITLMKLLALQFKKPLILLPQTYGPFQSESNKKIASEIVKKAKYAWARDSRSYAVLKNLLGDSYDPHRHRCGVDVAFGLPGIKPVLVTQTLQDFFKKNGSEIIGINISGLIYNNPAKAKEQFGLKADYNKVLFDLLRRFLKETDCKIALIPHVVTPKGHYESDLDACADVVARLGGQGVDRINIIPAYENPCEVKWVIQQCDWFCGTRMHATIAALSSAIPASAISYSPKTLGVFETCGQGEHVADPQKLGAGEMVEWLWHSWRNRKRAKINYEDYLPIVKKMVDEQIRLILKAT